LSNAWNCQHITGVERLDFCESPKMRIIKGEKSGNLVLNHERDHAHIVGLLALNRMLGNQTFPSGIYLVCLGKKLKNGSSGCDLGICLLRAYAKPFALTGRVKTTYISYMHCGAIANCS